MWQATPMITDRLPMDPAAVIKELVATVETYSKEGIVSPQRFSRGDHPAVTCKIMDQPSPVLVHAKKCKQMSVPPHFVHPAVEELQGPCDLEIWEATSASWQHEGRKIQVSRAKPFS